MPNVVLIKLKPTSASFRPVVYHLSNDLYLLAKTVNESTFIYRAYRPGKTFNNHGIHTSDIEEVFSFEYAKANFPEFFI